MKRSQLRRIIKEEMGMLNENKRGSSQFESVINEAFREGTASHFNSELSKWAKKYNVKFDYKFKEKGKKSIPYFIIHTDVDDMDYKQTLELNRLTASFNVDYKPIGKNLVVESLTKNEDKKFLQAAIKEFSKKTGITIPNVKPKTRTFGDNTIYTIDISNKLSMNPILLLLFSELNVEFTDAGTLDEDKYYVVNIDWRLTSMGSNGTRVGHIQVNKQTGKARYFKK